MTSHISSISPSFKSGSTEKNSHDRPQSPEFVRSTKIEGAAKMPVNDKGSHTFSGAMGHALEACDRLGIAPGQHRVLMIGNEQQVLYRTASSDGYVLQKADDFRASRRNGIHLSNQLRLTLDQQNITQGHPRYTEAMKLVTELLRVIHPSND